MQLALASFYEQDDNNPIDDVINMRMEEEAGDEERAAAAAAGAAAATTAASAAPSSVGRPPVSFSASGGSSAGGFSGTVSASSAAAAEKKKKKAAKYKPSSGPRIATIHNMGHSSSDEEDDDEEEGQAFYTGSERSGQQILGPPRRRGNDFVSEIFRSAQESGAEVVDPHQAQQQHAHAHSGAAGPSRFAGTGYRLGQTEDDHVRLPDPAASSSTGGVRGRPANIQPVVLKLWRQGFSINDGELRSYEEPANKEFLESIMKGEIPAELRQQGGHMVHVDLEDHRHEDFVRTVPRVRAFAGRGHTLGSPAPEVVGSVPAGSAAAVPAAAPAADPAADQKA